MPLAGEKKCAGVHGFRCHFRHFFNASTNRHSPIFDKNTKFQVFSGRFFFFAFFCIFLHFCKFVTFRKKCPKMSRFSPKSRRYLLRRAFCKTCFSGNSQFPEIAQKCPGISGIPEFPDFEFVPRSKSFFLHL
jgi:hypothetical protein